MNTTAWLLEWPADDNMPSRYWHPKTGWMVDPLKACWFAREDDAAGYRAASVMHGIIRPVEHVFGLQLCPTEAESAARLDLSLLAAEEAARADRLRDLLTRAREYVTDALDAHEHSDGRDLLREIDAALGPAGLSGPQRSEAAVSVHDEPISLTKPTDTQTAGGE